MAKNYRWKGIYNLAAGGVKSDTRAGRKKKWRLTFWDYLRRHYLAPVAKRYQARRGSDSHWDVLLG